MLFRDGALTWVSNESFLYTASIRLLLGLVGFSGFPQKPVKTGDAAGEKVNLHVSCVIYIHVCVHRKSSGSGKSCLSQNSYPFLIILFPHECGWITVHKNQDSLIRAY